MKKRIIAFCVFIIFFISGCNHTQRLSNNSNFMYEKKNGEIEIISHEYNADQKEITVPEFIDGCPVTVIHKDAFYQHTDTNNIILPSTITTIYGSPFYRCYSLKECVIPQNVAYIESNPFFRCSSLQKITVDSRNLYFSDDDGVLFNEDKTILIAYPEGKADKIYSIPLSVVKICDDAFGYRSSVEKLIVYSNVEKFPDFNMFVFPNDITMVVEANSAAEEYAKTYEINYQIIE